MNDVFCKFLHRLTLAKITIFFISRFDPLSFALHKVKSATTQPKEFAELEYVKKRSFASYLWSPPTGVRQLTSKTLGYVLGTKPQYTLSLPEASIDFVNKTLFSKFQDFFQNIDSSSSSSSSSNCSAIKDTALSSAEAIDSNSIVRCCLFKFRFETVCIHCAKRIKWKFIC